MQDEDRTKEQLVAELHELRQRLAESEKDKAEHRGVEEAQKASEERLRGIFDNLRDGLLLADKETKKVLMGNSAVHRMLGYTAEELKRIRITDIHPEQDLRWVIDRFEELARKEIEIARDIPVKRKDGGVFYADISSSFPMVFDGKECVTGVFRDITERKRAEDLLQTLIHRFYTVLSSLYAGVLLVREDGQVEFANKSFCDLFDLECSPEELRGLSPSEIIERIQSAYADPVGAVKRIQEILDRGLPMKCEEVALCDGRTCLRDFIPLDIEGKRYGRLWHHQDITELKRAEEVLRESDIQFKKLSSHVPGMIYQFMKRLDGTYCVPFTTEAIKDIFDCSPQDVREDFSPITRVILAEDLDRLICSIESSAERMTTWQCEYRVQIPGWPIRWMFGHSTPEQLADGSIIWHGFNTDITDRKQAEEALRESQEQLKETHHLARIGIWDWIADTDTVHWSRELYDIAGWDPQLPPPSYKEHPNIYAPASWDLLRSAVERALITGEPYHLELELIRPEGTTRWVNAFGGRKCDSTQRVIGLHGMVQDITEQKLAEAALRESQERLRLALESSRAGIWDRNVIENKSIWDDYHHLLFGLAPGTYSGNPKDFFSMIHPDDRDRVKDEMTAAIDGEAEYSTTYRVIWPDSSVHFLADRGKVYRDGTGRVVRLIGISWDISELKQAEESLRESERKFHSIFDSMSEIVVLHELICDAVGRPVDYRILDCNPAFTRSTGIPVERAVGALASQLYDASEIPYLESYAQVALMGKPMQFEAYFAPMRKHFAISAVSPAQGRFATVSTDITDSKQAQEASRTHIHFLENLELVDEAIKQETDVEKMLWNVMKTVFEIFGCDRAWLFYPCDPDSPSFRIPVEINRPEYPGAKALLEVPLVLDLAKDLRDALASEDPLPYTLGTEKPVNTFTAQQFAVQAQMFMAIYPKTGKPWVFGMHQCSYPRIWSPQEQKLFKEIGRRIADGLSSVLFLHEVKENEERFRATFEQAAVGMAHVAPDGRLLRVNQKLCDIVGYSIDELLQKTLQDITHPDDLDADLGYVRQVLTGIISTFSMEKRYLRKDSSVVCINLTVSIVRHACGDLEYFIFVIEDITEHKQAEEERRMLEERLQRAEKMEALGTLAGGVAHDLNNVLGIVVGYSELLLDDLDESSSARSEAMEILKGGQKAAAIVQDLLTLARRGVSSRKVLNLNNIVSECQNSPGFANILSYHPNVEVKIDFEADLLNISGSSVHLEKSFMNLVSNAAEAMPNGGTLTVKTANCYLDKPISGYDEVREGDYVVLSVTDKGQGIPASDLKRIFEPFYTKKVMGRSGTGLGLAVIWGTVKDHLGYINVESEERKGTTFTLYFPVTREEISLEEVSISAAEYMGKGESILVVDDVKEQRNLATMMLTKLNYRVSSVSSGEEAVDYIKQYGVDMVVLDMIMDPGMDGLDTYAKILEIHPDQKVIIVSGFSETERVTKAQALGAGAYVKKPYVLEKLGLAVRKEIDRPT